MKIIGDVKTATKFYITNSKGSIEWVPNLAVARRYVSDPLNTEWYGRDIYATNENLVKNKKGIICLASAVKSSLTQLKTLKQQFEDFKDQANSYLEAKLQEFSKKYGYDTIWTMISWENSSVKQYKNESKLAIDYRDTVYKYYFDFINNLENKINTNQIEENDLEIYYNAYIKDFPGF